MHGCVDFSMDMHVCMYASASMYYVCMSGMRVRVRACLRICVYMRVCIYVSMHVCNQVCVHVCIDVYT